MALHKGSRSRYKKGCRCKRCTKANTDWHRAYQARRRAQIRAEDARQDHMAPTRPQDGPGQPRRLRAVVPAADPVADGSVSRVAWFLIPLACQECGAKWEIASKAGKIEDICPQCGRVDNTTYASGSDLRRMGAYILRGAELQQAISVGPTMRQ